MMTPEREAMYRRAIAGGYATPVEVELFEVIDSLRRTITRREVEIAEQREDLGAWVRAYENLKNTKPRRKR